MRISKVTTTRGDRGRTSLGDGRRVPKDHPRIVALGEVDELNAVLGLAAAAAPSQEETTNLRSIQNDLFDLGGELSLGGQEGESQEQKGEPRAERGYRAQEGEYRDQDREQEGEENRGENRGELREQGREQDREEDRVAFLETGINKMNRDLPPLKEFLLPGGDEFASRLQVARVVCRRAERALVTLNPPALWLRYLNRLSDYLFVLARYHTHLSGGVEQIWKRSV